MGPFARRGIGELYLRTLSKPAFRVLMGFQGVADRSVVSNAELDAYVDLLKREDDGRAFLQIMRGFERTSAERDLYRSVLGSEATPCRSSGVRRTRRSSSTHGEAARRAAGAATVHRLPAKHFLQEDQAPAIAELVAAITRA